MQWCPKPKAPFGQHTRLQYLTANFHRNRALCFAKTITSVCYVQDYWTVTSNTADYRVHNSVEHVFTTCVCVILMLSLADQKKQAVGYKCPTLVACKHLWKCSVEQQYFYTYDDCFYDLFCPFPADIFCRHIRFVFRYLLRQFCFAYA